MNLAIALAEEADRPTEWPGLGRRPPSPFALIVVANRAQVDSISRGRAPAWGVGVALPATHTILLRADAADIRRTLRHELAHLALHGQVPVRVPLWFDEGYAAWAAGEWERLGGLELNLALVRGAVPDFRGLDGALRASEQTADAAYALAMSAVLELARRNPTGTLEPLMARLGAGEDFDLAVRETTGLTLAQFEDGWRRAVRTRYSVATWVVAGGAWVILAVAVLGLGWRRRRVDRVRRADLDRDWLVEEEEGAEPPQLDPDPNS